MKKINVEKLEKDFVKLIEKHGVGREISIRKIKKWVLEEDGSREAHRKFIIKCFSCFPEFDIDDRDMDILLRVVQDSWNVYPHNCLDGRSPKELYEENYPGSSEKSGKIDKSQMPNVIVGEQEMEFGEFERMIEEMERVQKPFKAWIDNEVLPKYEKFLKTKYKGKATVEKYYDVAFIFFERVLHLGFIDMESIRDEFISEEFPNWWPSHVMHYDFSPDDVRRKLGMLFDFLYREYEV